MANKFYPTTISITPLCLLYHAGQAVLNGVKGISLAWSLVIEIAYANRLHTGHTRNQAVGIGYLTCHQSSALPVVSIKFLTKLRVVTGKIYTEARAV
jgi:hypothetical protein